MKVKKMFAIILTLVLVVAVFAVPASAAVHEEDMVEPCAHACSCGGIYRDVVRYEYTGSQYYVICSHGKSGYDLVRDRYKIVGVRCDGCGDGWNNSKTLQPKYLLACQGN